MCVYGNACGVQRTRQGEKKTIEWGCRFQDGMGYFFFYWGGKRQRRRQLRHMHVLVIVCCKCVGVERKSLIDYKIWRVRRYSVCWCFNTKTRFSWMAPSSFSHWSTANDTKASADADWICAVVYTHYNYIIYSNVAALGAHNKRNAFY